MKEKFVVWKSLRGVLWVAAPVALAEVLRQLQAVQTGNERVQLIVLGGIVLTKALVDYISHPGRA